MIKPGIKRDLCFRFIWFIVSGFIRLGHAGEDKDHDKARDKAGPMPSLYLVHYLWLYPLGPCGGRIKTMIKPGIKRDACLRFIRIIIPGFIRLGSAGEDKDQD